MKIKFIKDGIENIYTKGIRALSKEIKISMPVIYKYIVLQKEYKGYLFEMLNEDLETRNTRKRDELLNVDKNDIRIKKIYKIKVINNNEELIYNGIRELHNSLNIHIDTIKKYAHSGKEYKGYKFEILNCPIAD